MKYAYHIPFHSVLKVLATSLLLLVLSAANSQTDTTKYNRHLADSLGADDYGMKMYVLVILKSGKKKIEDKKVSDSLFTGHMKNINYLVEKGKLIVAGPMGKNGKELEGIFILNVKTIEEANALLEGDTAIKAGALEAELYQWYGSAALPLYLKFHDHVKRKSF